MLQPVKIAVFSPFTPEPTEGQAMYRRMTRWVVPFGILGLSLIAAAARADEPAEMVLFDGKSLEGWVVTDFFGHGAVEVADGQIRLGQGDPMTGVTTTRTDLPTLDYELSYEARRVSGSDFFAAATFPVGTGFLTFVNGGWGGQLTGLSSLDGADASENETGRSYDYKNDTWYRFRVRVTAAAVRCDIDLKEVVAARIAGRQARTRIEVRSNQPLGFASYDTTGAIRNVHVRKLSADEIAATALPEDP
jgi:hypothetical protein